MMRNHLNCWCTARAYQRLSCAKNGSRRPCPYGDHCNFAHGSEEHCQVLSHPRYKTELPEYPSKLFFFCKVELGSGGETSVVLRHIVYERMKQKHPEFVEKLEEHGLINTKVLGEEDYPTLVIGRGWKSAFSTDDKSVVEERHESRMDN